MRLSDRPPARRSELFAWYMREWEVLRGAPINWRWLMGEIAKRNLVDRRGKSPSPQTAKQTWHRCNRMMKEREDSKAWSLPPRRPPPLPADIIPAEPTRVPRQFPPAKIKE